MASIRSIASIMDPVHWPLPDPQDPSSAPAISIRTLAGGHRWPGIEPSPMPPDDTTFRPIPDPFSLRVLFDRHENQSTTLSRFLSYNTYLLPGVPLPWDEFINSAIVGGIEGALKVFARTALEVLVGINLSVEDILKFTFSTLNPLDFLEAFGVSISNLADELGVPDIVGDALEAIIDFVGIGAATSAAEKLIIAVANETGLQLTDVIALTKQEPLDLLLIVLAKLNMGPTAMLAAVGIHLPGSLGEKPAIRERASEIALATMESYEIMALSEVFVGEQRDIVMNTLKTSPRGFDFHPGPDEAEPFVNIDGGLLVATATRPIAHDLDNDLVYSEDRGNRFKDTDAWANKGVLKTVINVGVGFIELYNTHTIAGGDMGLPNLGRTHQEVVDLRMAQLGKLLEFYESHHDPRNVAIITGDFNLNTKIAEDYAALQSLMLGHNMYDLWPRWNRADVERSTHDVEEPTNHDLICLSDPFGAPDPYCNVDNSPHAPEGGCIDYIFVERPTAAHTFNLDFSLVRRRPFRRIPTGGEEEPREFFMSDHIGLDVLLIASPLP